MNNNKVNCMAEAQKFGNYLEIDKFGYGGYKYIKDRWKLVAQKLLENII